MDDGRGRFVPLTEEEVEERRKALDALTKATRMVPTGGESRDLPRIFRIGQTCELNGSRFRVAKIAKRRLILKLLADGEA